MSKVDLPLWTLFEQLRRLRFPLGPDDYYALRQALRAGFGWSSRRSLRDLCCALWAKSHQEQEILIALFDRLELPDWRLPQQMISSSAPVTSEVESSLDEAEMDEDEEEEAPPDLSAQEAEPAPVTHAYKGLPPIRLGDVVLSQRPFIFVPQFVPTYRETAQAWRRLRRPVRSGIPTELDVEATVESRCRRGIASSVVLVPRRRNTARLLLLVDRQGSMAPFRGLVDTVCRAIQQAGKLESAALYYFHDTPVEDADKTVLEPIVNQLFPTLDAVLPRIAPLTEGYVYDDPELTFALPLADVLKEYAVGAAVVILSDAGAARGRYDLSRLLNTVAFLKGLPAHTSQCVWLNPLPKRYWANSTAAQIARHVHMFPLDRDGMFHAVNALRGQPYPIERPV